MRDIAVVTGASEGIGAELARILAREGHDLALVARRRERLEALADEIAATGRPRPLSFACDLAEPGGPDALDDALAHAGARVAILVNNAGYGLHGAAARLPRESQLGIVDLNIRALTDLTLRYLPQIVASRGRILQVASTAAFLPGPHMAVYYASKAYVLSFGEALAQEIKATGATVSVLCPGPTSTGFQARAGLDATLFRLMRPMDARAVAEAGYAGLMRGDRVIVPGAFNKASRIITGLSPRALLLPLLGRLQENRRR
jgi:short-subunit dehydrogenase